MSLNSSPRRGRILVPAHREPQTNHAGGIAVPGPQFMYEEGLEDEDGGGYEYQRMSSPNQSMINPQLSVRLKQVIKFI
jgi:hypothetical protein